MSKSPGLVKALDEGSNKYARKIVFSANNNQLGGKAYYVLVSHQELDGLVGRLMQMCDLIGDLEQRTALKSTIKQIGRDWLDNLYDDSGYDRWTGIKEGLAQIIED